MCLCASALFSTLAGLKQNCQRRRGLMQNWLLTPSDKCGIPPEKKSERQAHNLLDTRKATQSRSGGKENEAQRENYVLNVLTAKTVSNRAYTSPDLQHTPEGKTASCGPVITDLCFCLIMYLAFSSRSCLWLRNCFISAVRFSELSTNFWNASSCKARKRVLRYSSFA